MRVSPGGQGSSKEWKVYCEGTFEVGLGLAQELREKMEESFEVARKKRRKEEKEQI